MSENWFQFTQYGKQIILHIISIYFRHKIHKYHCSPCKLLLNQNFTLPDLTLPFPTLTLPNPSLARGPPYPFLNYDTCCKIMNFDICQNLLKIILGLARNAKNCYKKYEVWREPDFFERRSIFFIHNNTDDVTPTWQWFHFLSKKMLANSKTELKARSLK